MDSPPWANLHFLCLITSSVAKSNPNHLKHTGASIESPMNDYQLKLENHILRAKLGPEYDISFKSVFGARAAYVNGHIFSSCGKFGFALKLPSDVCAKLFDEGLAIPLKYFDKGHVKRNYAVVKEDSPKLKSRLKRLVVDSVKFSQVET